MTTYVLVTGGAGYLGSIVNEHLLKAGYRVTVVDNLVYGQHSLFHLCANPAFDFVLGDVRDEGLMRHLVKNVDVIIPLAAITAMVFFLKSYSNPLSLLISELESCLAVPPTPNTDSIPYCLHTCVSGITFSESLSPPFAKIILKSA
jgi:UDP-glucose 4-epimerase